MVLNQPDISPTCTYSPSLRLFAEGGVAPSDNKRADMELISKRIGELKNLELELAIRYGMAGFTEIDSVEVFDEAKYRAFSDDARCIQEAELLYELYTLRHQCATGGFEAFSLANPLAVEGKNEG
ncbi:hypothetical protein ARMGADRAFT_1088387 [Armillaria gallica]|uniref:Uncharacterized protein n=1 Tax=Armillaria gallica TaxID=47427 RepID=A0A2H3CR53_ARMGA|nr:hypothetical protein ARMGADRAFT_1088387 [Armillaria gallica]